MWCQLATALTGCLCLAGSVNARSNDVAELSDMIERTTPLRTHSIAPPYVDSDLQNRWWDFGGDAIINTNKHIRLTQDRSSEKGWLWSRMPLSSTSFQIEVEFAVDGKAHNLFGDGFAMWLSKDRGTLGPVFGSVDYFNGLGIFFDTYANSKHAYTWPRVTAMMGDGKTAYDHDHDNDANELGACSENFRRREVPTKLRLTYIKGQSLELKLQTQRDDKWTKCFEVEVDLPDAPFLGFSALTGDVSDNHDIVSVQTSNVILHPEYRKLVAGNDAQAPMGNVASRPTAGAVKAGKRGKVPKSSGGAASWFLFILKLIGVGAFIAFAVAAYRTYDAQKKSKRAW